MRPHGRDDETRAAKDVPRIRLASSPGHPDDRAAAAQRYAACLNPSPPYDEALRILTDLASRTFSRYARFSIRLALDFATPPILPKPPDAVFARARPAVSGVR
jgi:hypothetical protein